MTVFLTFNIVRSVAKREKKKIEDSPWNTDLANSLLTADVQQMMDDKGSGLDAGSMALHYVNDDDTVQPVVQFRGTPDCNESAALHSYGLDAHCRSVLRNPTTGLWFLIL